MIRARAGTLTLRRFFPRVLRLALTLVAILLVGFYGAANAARRPGSGWAYGQLPVFVNLAPRDVRQRATEAMKAAAANDPSEAQRGRAELLRLGGAALPHVLPQLDTLEPTARGRVALALGPVALRMRVAAPESVDTAERALLFFGRFWQDRSIEFRPTTVRRAVDRLAERSLTLRREDVVHADTYALEALIHALGSVRDASDVGRVARLHPLLMQVTGRGSAFPSPPSLSDASRAVERWQALWLEEGADYSVLEGPRRVAAIVTETQYGKWLAQAMIWQLGRDRDGNRVLSRVVSAFPRSMAHVVLLLLLALTSAALSGVAGETSSRLLRMRASVAAMAASLVALYPVVLTLALAVELKTGGVLELCARALRAGDVNLTMGALLGLALLSELLVAVPSRLAAHAHVAETADEGE